MIKKELKNFHNKKIAILGYGVNNIELVNFFIKQKIALTICDHNHSLSQNLFIKKNNRYIELSLGEKYLDNLSSFDVVFRSPGIPYLNSKIQQAQKKGVEISSQTKLFFDLCPAKIIGVTGTKGKGTTSTLIYNILKKSGKKVYLAGNIGSDPFSFLHKLKKTDWVILELSSFQLQDLHQSPHIAVVLNITSDHLDKHKNIREYREAKKTVTKYQSKNDFKVLNFDYNISKNYTKFGDGQIYYFSRKKSFENGCYVLNNEIVLKFKKNKSVICKTSEVGLLGEHNLENITAGIMASRLAGASLESIKYSIKNFKGLPHRLELSGVVDGVRYYNDSFSTNADTTLAAIKTFAMPIILILGGSDKGANYEDLAKKVLKTTNIKNIILIGQTAKKISEELKKISIQNKIAKLPIIKRGLKNIKQVVEYSNSVSSKGDVVLLSPASASFGMFKDYKERGCLFKKAVVELKNEKTKK